MRIYLVVDNPPTEWGRAEVRSVHLRRSTALAAITKAKSTDSYTNQYLEVQAHTVQP